MTIKFSSKKPKNANMIGFHLNTVKQRKKLINEWKSLANSLNRDIVIVKRTKKLCLLPRGRIANVIKHRFGKVCQRTMITKSEDIYLKK